MTKISCKECGWKGDEQSLLTANNPFHLSEQITGCPQCDSINSTIQVCDVPDCWDDINSCWPNYAIEYLADILNGDYSVAGAREDLESLIGSIHDPRAGGDPVEVK